MKQKVINHSCFTIKIFPSLHAPKYHHKIDKMSQHHPSRTESFYVYNFICAIEQTSPQLISILSSLKRDRTEFCFIAILSLLAVLRPEGMVVFIEHFLSVVALKGFIFWSEEKLFSFTAHNINLIENKSS